MNKLKKLGVCIAMGSATVIAQAADNAKAFGPDNPFYAESKLPFQAPPFDRIHDSDIEPAMDAGIAQKRAEMEKIANDPAAPTFANTLVAMERTGRLLQRVMAVFSDLSGSNTDPELQALEKRSSPKMAALSDSIYLNPKLFARVETIYNERATLNLDPESERLLEVQYQRFIKAGAKLSPEDKEKLKKINEELASLSTSFVTKLLAGTKDGAFHTTDAAALAGMSPAQLSAAQTAAKTRKVDGYVVPLQNTTQQPDLAELSNRDTRKQIFENSWLRNEHGDANDTRATVLRLAELRAEKAKLLGFPNFAAWNLQDQMAKTPANALKFMNDLVPATVAKADGEAKDIQALIDEQKGGFELQPWDWEFYSEQVRKAKYSFDSSEVKPYFLLDRVIEDGVFYAANRMYGITFEERKDIPVYRPEIRVWEVFDKDGKPLALFYGDYFARDNKRGGAWMSSFVGQSKLLGTLPVVKNTLNLPQPAPGEPALIDFDGVRTLFHEFGHALHGMFADSEYPSLSGTSVPRDFVEFPSQFNEHWASEPTVFAHYAKNYKTGAPMPAELKKKIDAASKFNEGYMFGELLAAAQLDMQWHTIGTDAHVTDVDAFEKQALARTHMNMAKVPPRYRSSYFQHIWSNGYSAGYYAYLWSEMLDDAAFDWFEKHGGMTRENGERFRKMVLSRGNTEDLQTMYDRWHGSHPDVEPMLEERGLKQ
ncbi:MAG: peptidyl-dipeptidase Dcp [Acidobacteriaceae bacterium]|nr:peptidyl-dipeptidase Dcp [Acidobacteriaceae bacterium]